MPNNFFENLTPDEQKLFLEDLIPSLHPETSAWLSARLMIRSQKIVSFPDLADLDFSEYDELVRDFHESTRESDEYIRRTLWGNESNRPTI